MSGRQRPSYLADLPIYFLLLVAHIALFFVMAERRSGDPDYYFHLALARQTAESGLIRSLPQAENIGWGSKFLEKQWVFTTASGIAYKIAGEKGCEALVLLIGIAFLIGFMRLMKDYGLPSWQAALLYLGPLSLSGFVFIRVMGFRPTVLAMAFLVWILWAIGRNRAVLTGVLCMLCVQSYHAVYLPALFLGAFLVVELLTTGKPQKAVLYGFAGLIAGQIVTPYFPNNLLTTWNGIAIALNLSKVDVEFRAVELGSLTLTELRREYVICSLALLLVPALVFYMRGNRFLKDKKLLPLDSTVAALWLSTLGFGVMASFISRAGEYFVLSSVLLVAIPVGYGKLFPGKSYYYVGTLFLLTAVILLPKQIEPFQNRSLVIRQVHTLRVTAKEALEMIPPEDYGKKIYNCEWDVTPFVLYYRPEMRFLDISDPHLLKVASPVTYQIRKMVHTHETADLWATVKGVLGADYVLCTRGHESEQFEKDPNFRRVFPYQTNMGPNIEAHRALTLYKVNPRPLPQFVTGYRLAASPPLNPADYSKIASGNTPYRSVASQPKADEVRPAYLNLLGWAEREKVWDLSKRRPSAKDPFRLCVWASPEPWEMRRLAGAEVLGIGGGPYMKVFLNGKPLLHSGESLRYQKGMVTLQVPLERPIKATDKLETAVCANPIQGEYLGVSLSLWKKGDIDKLCGDKRAPNPGFPDPKYSFVASPGETCLGPVVQPNYAKAN